MPSHQANFDFNQVAGRPTECAQFDELTGLPNRVGIQRRVEARISGDNGERRFALAFIDLDDFKHINDYYGHGVGDALLVKIGQRITPLLRPTDLLARISGDEFLLLIDPFESEKGLKAIVTSVLNELKQPYQIEGFELFSSCSVGVSVFPDYGRNYEELRRNADIAMYNAKRRAKGEAIYFDFNMAKAVAARAEAEQRLRLAIRDRRLCCALQPKVDIYNDKVVGFETLARCRGEDGEIHPPSEFIGLAHELGLINQITEFILSETIDSIDCVDAAFGAGTSVSINVAARQANDVDFMYSLIQTIKDSRLAERFIVELTEDAFAGGGAFQTQILPVIRTIGMRVSIDDFGTGYSSLSTLADLMADEIKIDRSFITAIHQRPRNQSVLRAIESLAQALNMTIIAEGVETYEELVYLRAASRIRYVQGFYFGKPFLLDDVSQTTCFTSRRGDATRRRTHGHNAAPPRSHVYARSGG